MRTTTKPYNFATPWKLGGNYTTDNLSSPKHTKAIARLIVIKNAVEKIRTWRFIRYTPNKDMLKMVQYQYAIVGGTSERCCTRRSIAVKEHLHRKGDHEFTAETVAACIVPKLSDI